MKIPLLTSYKNEKWTLPLVRVFLQDQTQHFVQCKKGPKALHAKMVSLFYST